MGVARLLVANRGEIAARIFRTCNRLGIETVAIAAPDDEGAFHTRAASRTVAVATYLAPDEIVRAARESEADAVHPGYGFLAESAALAEAVEGAGLTWVGPPAEALRLGGDKVAAKRIAAEAGVPVLLQGEPEDIGFPLLVKAAAGGGGRGMRIVRSPEELEDALSAARREAEAAFGDPSVFCERYLERARHVEVQMLADAHGSVVAIGERDCSVQRRHQKVLEEAPAPRLGDDVRGRLHAAAVAFAQAIGYRSAGTAEFLVDGEAFYFLELNARIQVEHPVTEAVTGLDLIELQLRIAAGEPLNLDVQASGHAVEARLYAEDPRTFLPQAGRVERLRLPTRVRVDAGIAEGDEVGLAYDPLIAKLISADVTRAAALDRLADALDETEVSGVTTNLPFLRWLVGHPAFRAAELSTSFLTEHPPLAPHPQRLPQGAWAQPWRLNMTAPLVTAPPDVEQAAHAHARHGGEQTVVAPMPGTVLAVLVAAGDAVQPRQPLVVLEAMKMEHPVASPFGGVVKAVRVDPGDRVAGGAVLVELEQ
jgi:acetyl-CoA/propionyl-CoA/long-chain acyl-CoA carboxylase, biotin carboxylase, biotin carboxyl carrier protein